MATAWKPVSEANDVFEGRDLFGSNSQIRALAEGRVSMDAQEKFAPRATPLSRERA